MKTFKRSYLSLVFFVLLIQIITIDPIYFVHQANAQTSPTTIALRVELNTAALMNSGGPLYLDFTLIDGADSSEANRKNTISLSNFEFSEGNAVGDPKAIEGGASGKITENIILEDTFFLNHFTQKFKPGKKLSFNILSTKNSNQSGGVDGFTFYILDSDFKPIPTLGNGDSLLAIAYGPSGIQVGRFPTDLQRTSIKIPEPIVSEVAIPTAADVVLSATAKTNTVKSGEMISWTLILNNKGLIPSANVSISVSLTGAASIDLCSSPGSTCSGTSNTRTITFSTIPAGTSTTITITAKVNADAPIGSEIINTATVTASTPDPDTSNNTATTKVTVVAGTPAAPIAITKLEPKTIGSGEQKTLIIEATLAPSDALLTNSVTLLRYNDKDELVSNLGQMFDDGTHGDRIAGDNIFTTQIVLQEAVPQTIFFKASAAYKGQLKRLISPPETLTVTPSTQSLQRSSPTKRLPTPRTISPRP